MLPRARQENRADAPQVDEEIKAENNSIQPIGNEGLQNVLPVVPGAGNEAMNALINNVQENQPRDVYYDEMEQMPLFYQDPEEPEQVQAPEEPEQKPNTDDLNNALDEDDPLNQSMIAVRPKRKKIKKKDSKKKKSPAENNDLDQINDQMAPAAGMNFNAQKLGARERTNWWRKFLTGTAKFFGNTLGKAINVVQNFFRGTYWSKKYRQSQSEDTDNPTIKQEKRHHNIIPGWEGKKFEKAAGQEDDIMTDFRRVPTVWSYVTAGKAAEKVQQGDKIVEKPLPPTISVNVNQPKEAVDQTMSSLNAGHTGLGLEYSRYSQISGRYERYALKYGFYMSGGTLSTMSLTSTRGGRFPGQLINEKDHNWMITRTFPAKNKQINDIIKASETWADKGYNGLTRNCTTFVKEMVQDVAHLQVPGNIFEMEAPRVSSLGNLGLFTGAAHDTNAKINTEEQMEELSGKEDKSYAGWGNMRVTKQDYRQYKEHQSDKNTTDSLSDSPNAVAENMRRLEGDGSGTISSSSYQGTLKDLVRNAKLDDYYNAIESESEKLYRVILKVTGKRNIDQVFTIPNISAEETGLIAGVGNLTWPLGDLRGHTDDPDALRVARAGLDTEIGNLNKLLFNVFGNDKRMNVPVLHMISLLKNASDYVDTLYANADYGRDNKGDLGNMRSQTKQQFEIRSDEDNITVSMSPSHYEAYLQIYKSPRLAVQKYDEYKKLNHIQATGERSLTSREKDNLSKAERMEKLANQFDRAHDYMLEKTSYSQQDVDYVFSLGKKETSEKNVGGQILNNSAAKVYKALILEKIFGGMKQRLLNHLSEEEAGDQAKVQAWLDKDISTCINRKKDDVVGVLTALKRTSNEEIPTKESMRIDFFP